MWRRLLSISLISVSALALSACGDGNPFDDPAAGAGGGGSGGTGGNGGSGAGDAAGGGNSGGATGSDNPLLDTGTTRPPDGTPPQPGDYSVTRLEAEDGNGGGYVSGVIYDSDGDKFLVDGLAFDGSNTYSRWTNPGKLGPDQGGYAVYAADVTVQDFLTGQPIGQVQPYRAIYGMSANNTSATDERPRTSFAIVRTGGYTHYGFGGFLYARNGSVTLPEQPFGPGHSGQATFSGDYAGLRVFDNTGGLEYTQGRATIDVDFRDFNSNQAVKGAITDRQVFDENGVEITQRGSQIGDGGLLLPDIDFVVSPGLAPLDPSGEIAGNVVSRVEDSSGNRVDYETGTYYGVIAGDLNDPADRGEIVGIIVIESPDNRDPNRSVQETGGFIVYR